MQSSRNSASSNIHERTFSILGCPATSDALSYCEDEKAGRGVENIIETDCTVGSFGLAVGPGLCTAVKLIGNAGRGETTPMQAAKGQEIK